MRLSVAALALALTLAGLLAPAAAADACDAGARRGAAGNPDRVGRAPVVIGDSTSIIAVPELGRRGLEADARGCRQFAQGVQMLAARRRAGTLPHVAVLALGANGPVSSASIAAALRVTGPRRILALVTPKSSGSSRAAMRRAASRHGDRVLLIDWASFSAGHGGWFAGDGLHVGHEGANAFASLIRRKVEPFAFPPVRRLNIGPPGARGASCGVVRRGGRRLAVHVARGESRLSCARARALVRRPPLRRIPGWRVYDWRASRPRTWSWVYARPTREVLVGAVAAR
jgi:hypothetical protein